MRPVNSTASGGNTTQKKYRSAFIFLSSPLVCAVERWAFSPPLRPPLFSTGSLRSLDLKAKVIVMPKAVVLDPQGNAVRDAMRHLGMPEVRSVRIGKYMEIDIEGQNGDFESRLHRLCRDLLSNPVIEDYELQKSEDWNHKKTPNSERLREQGARRRTPINREQASNAQHP